MKKNISLHTDSLLRANCLYNFSGLKMSFCTAPDSKGNIALTHIFERCRESVCDFVRQQVAGPNRNKTKIDIKRTRLVFFMRANDNIKEKTAENFRKKKDKEMLTALKLVNHYEKKHGWSRTRIQKLENKCFFKDAHNNDIKNHIHMYMAVGSSRWLKAPHLLSLYLLMFRICTRGFESKFKNDTELAKELEEFSLRVKTKKYVIGDHGFVNRTYNKWDILLDNYKRLFGKRTLKDLYSKESLVNKCDGFNEGIYRLCSGHSYDLKTSIKFSKLCAEKKIEMVPRIRDDNEDVYN